jgi:hypothetical protein
MTQDRSFQRPGSPESPGDRTRERFWDPMNLGVGERCNTEGWTNPNWLQCDAPPDPGDEGGDSTASLMATAGEDPCAPWAGPFVEVLICTPGAVARAEDDGALSARGSVAISGADRGDAVASAPGVTQLVGDVSADPAGVTLAGTLPPRTRVIVRAERHGKTFESRFDNVRLQRGQRLRVSLAKLADGRVAARLSDRGRRSIAPDRVKRRRF